MRNPSEPTPGANDALAVLAKEVEFLREWWGTSPMVSRNAKLNLAMDNIQTLLAAYDAQAAALDAQTERVAALERDALPMEAAITVETSGARIDKVLHSVTIEMSTQDYQRLLDFGVKVSGQFVTFANPIPDGDDTDAAAPTRETPDEPVTAERTLAAIMSNDVKALTDIIDTPPAPGAGAAATKLPRLTKAQIKGLKVLAAQTKQPTPVWKETSHGCVHSGVAKVLVRLGLAETVRDGHNGSIRITPAGRAALADETPDGGDA